VVKQYPSPTLTEPTPGPDISIQTNGDLINALLATRKALAACNEDKASIRAWAAE
jgi:hypothetical protein